MTLTPGMMLLHEKYRVESLLGAGAFAEVYRVLHLQLNAPRAVKILRRDAAGLSSTEFGDYRARFELEAQLGAQLHHPHVIDVHDFEQEEGTLMLVMELAPGGSLADRIKKARSEGHPLGVEEAMTIAREIAEGLSALHAQEAVHRDVKPSNILFDVEGHAKLADLGLAQVPHGGSMRSSLSTAVKHPGTPPYMSPEQRDTGDPLQPPSDVYALGCVLFEMLTGRLYYNQRPGTRARGLRPEIDSGLDDLLAHMLAEKAGDRPWDGAEAAKSLEEAGQNRAEERRRKQQEEERRVQEAKNQEKELRARVSSLMDEGRQACERKEYALAISKWDEARKLSPAEAGLDAEIERARQELLEEEARKQEMRHAEEIKRQREAEQRRREDEEKRLEEEKTRAWESKRERLKQKVIQALDWALPKETETALNELANHLGYARDSDPEFSNLQGQLDSLKAELLQKEEEKRRLADKRRRKEEEEAAQERRTQEEARKRAEREEATGLVAAAAALLDRGAFDEAKTKLQEALRLDPAHVEAKAALDRCRDEKAEAEKKRSAPAKLAPNSIGMEFVTIPAGKFMMGCSPGDRECGAGEKPRRLFGLIGGGSSHEVTITRSLEFGQYEVTQGEWVKLMGKNPSDSRGDDRLPVVNVSWDDAQAFIAKLNDLNDGYRYRLPTEAEWEYAARAGTTAAYYGDLDSIAWYLSNSGFGIHPVGQKQPNGYGLYDMLGNVSEWCSDWYGKYYYGRSPAADPKGPSSGHCRVVRGGDYCGQPWYARVSLRSGYTPDFRIGLIGFRVCREKL